MSKIILKTPISYYGGKQNLCARIIDSIPEHLLYCEPFLGGAAVFFGKPPSHVEVLNDSNRLLMNFYKVVKHDYPALKKELQITLHSRDLYRKAAVIYNHPEMFGDVKLAWAVWVLANQGFGGKLESTWGYGRTSKYIVGKTINNRDRFTSEYAVRLENVQLECADAVYIIKNRDSDASFFYCDPPYFNSNCGHYNKYTKSDFEGLLETLATIKGKFLLSSYPSDILRKHVAMNGWHQQEIQTLKKVDNRLAERKTKTEVLTSNYEPDRPDST